MILDATPEIREKAKAQAVKLIHELEPDVSDRKRVYKIRRDMFEGKHQSYTNVVGLTRKEKQGHISAVFNYVRKMGTTLVRKITNGGFRIRVEEDDAANPVESQRAEAVEKFIEEVLDQNDFKKLQLKRQTTVQVRDGDFALKCYVEQSRDGGRNIKIESVDDMQNLYVLWDDSSGKTFSAIAYVNTWSELKMMMEFPDLDLSKLPVEEEVKGTVSGEHGDEYATDVQTSSSSGDLAPSYKGKNKKYKVVDYWAWNRVDGEDGEKVWKPINLIMVGTGQAAQVAQFVVTDYRRIPWFIGHSDPNPGKPWSTAFIDDLFDANVELNDRSGEEGDLVRAGANKKYLAKNMPDFDSQSVKTGSGQVIYIEGEGADFGPLNDTVNTFPSETYKNSMKEHLFNLGLPEIALSSGSGPYTGRAGAYQYQPVADIVQDYRDAWDIVLKGLFEMIQEYAIDYFPEMEKILTVSLQTSEGVFEDGPKIVRKVKFDWNNPIPLARSDAVVDAATLYDRKALSLKRLLEQAGFSDVNAVVKEIKSEFKDPELVGIRTRFEELTPAVQAKATEARRQELNQAESVDMSASQNAVPSPVTRGRESGRGVSSAQGSPATGQSAGGSNRQVQQNLNAVRGV